MAIRSFNIDLVSYKDISLWEPTISDIIIKHGLIIGSSYSIINSVNHNSNSFTYVEYGLPFLLFTSDEYDRQNKTKNGNIGKIKKSRHGKYSIIRSNNGNTIWFI